MSSEKSAAEVAWELLYARIAEIEADNARLREDAERWRWLRAHDMENWLRCAMNGDAREWLVSDGERDFLGSSLDEAIDKAMRGESGEG